jgi:hypothetical protein
MARADWRTGTHLGPSKHGADPRHQSGQNWPSQPPQQPPQQPPIGAHPTRRAQLEADRMEGVCLGYNTVDGWGWLRPRFAVEVRVYVVAAEISDGGGPLRAGDKITFKLSQGAMGQWLAQDVKRQ